MSRFLCLSLALCAFASFQVNAASTQCQACDRQFNSIPCDQSDSLAQQRCQTQKSHKHTQCKTTHNCE